MALAVRDTDALVAAVREVGFPVGHASAQLGWRGLRSRPTWRILLYSAEDPPVQRGYVVVDAVDGSVIGHFVEDNPEDWVALTGVESGRRRRVAHDGVQHPIDVAQVVRVPRAPRCAPS